MADDVRGTADTVPTSAGDGGGRQAANGVLAASGSTAARARLTNLYVPPEFTLAKLDDKVRYRLRLPNAYDIVQPYWP